ncbi:MAG TPA: membrane protein insertion efficiency factor YidD [Actinomycetota bacterium]
MLGRGAALLVRLYQLTVGRLSAPRCRFHPSCSEYTREALRRNGLFFGGIQSLWRLLRCGPWTAGGLDPVRPIGEGDGPGPIRRVLNSRLEVRRG